MISEKLYSQYLGALLRGDRHQCGEIVAALMAEHIDMNALYTNLLQRALYEVGELWERNRISVAVEHLATALTERLLAGIYPALLAVARPNGRKAVVTCSANEYHQIGARMVSDVMETKGWDVRFLGANTPADDLLLMIGEQLPEFLGLSVSISSNLASLYRLIDVVRGSYPQQDIFVGGQAFRWEGADIGQRFANVEHIPSLEDLGRVIAAS
jgi:MerR family transcriptional regulator, light-induced transcriptional regulator